MLASTPSGISSLGRVLIDRFQEYASDEVLFDLDYCLVDIDLFAHIETIHAHSNCTAFTVSMAMVENTSLDG